MWAEVIGNNVAHLDGVMAKLLELQKVRFVVFCGFSMMPLPWKLHSETGPGFAVGPWPGGAERLTERDAAEYNLGRSRNGCDKGVDGLNEEPRSTTMASSCAATNPSSSNCITVFSSYSIQLTVTRHSPCASHLYRLIQRREHFLVNEYRGRSGLQGLRKEVLGRPVLISVNDTTEPSGIL